MNEVFANRNKEDIIYPLEKAKIAETQQADATLKHLFKRNAVIDQGLEIKLIENMCLQRWLASYPQATPSPCSKMVSPLPTYSTLDTHISKRQSTQQCTGKVCIPPSVL
jgi:hypothetical protein